MKDTLILLLAFFNYKDVKMTLQSLIKPYKNNDIEIPFDIIVLENPSKYSSNMKIVTQKYSKFILKHYISDENVEGYILQYFLNNYKDITNKYAFISITEGDVVLEPKAFDECYELLNKYQNVGNVSIDLSLKNLDIPPLPPSAINWVPHGIVAKDHIIGPTGFQFILFRKSHLDDFMYHINNKLICNSIALGVDNFYGISDTNLISYNNIKNTPWIRTKEYKLVHIGWDHYKNPNDEYWLTRNDLIAKGKIRSNNIDRSITLNIIF